MENNLPKNWENCKLGDILKLKNGYAFKSKDYKNDGIPVIRISDIQQGFVTTRKSRCVDEFNTANSFIVEKGDVLVAMSGATTGKYGIFNEDIKVYQNQRVGNLIPHAKSLTSNNFIYYLLGGLKKEIEDKAYGGAQPNISSKLIEELDFKLPPLPEQERIVAMLDTLFGHLDGLKERLAGIPELLKQFRQAVLTQAVTGKLTEEWRVGKELGDIDLLIKKIGVDLNQDYEKKCLEAKKNGLRKPKDQRKNKRSDKSDVNLLKIPDSWSCMRAEEISYLITDGVHFKPNYIEDGVRFLSVKNVRPFKINEENCKYVSIDDHNQYIKRCNPENGDLLYTKVGATYGYASKVQIDFEFSIYVSLALIKPSRILNVNYLELLFNSPIVFNQARNRVSGSGVPDLHLIEIRDFKIPIPSLDEQAEIVKRVESLFAKADAIETNYQTLKTKIDDLPQAILAKAFKGELVEQLDTDGDAKDLLKEIRKLREAQETMKKKPKKRKK